MSNPEGKPHEFQLFQLFQVSKAMLRSEDGRLLGWDVLLPDLLRHGTKPPSWSSWIVLEAKGCSEQSTHFGFFWVRQSWISGTRNIAKTCNKKAAYIHTHTHIYTRIWYSKKPWHSWINALCGSVLPVGSDFNSFMSHNSTIEQYLKHSFHLTSIPWTSMDCWLVKVGPSCGLVDDFIHEHSKSAAEYPASSSLSTNLHGLQVISPGKIDLKNLHMDMAVNMGIYSLKHGNFIREKDDKPMDLAGSPKISDTPTSFTLSFLPEKIQVSVWSRQSSSVWPPSNLL